MATLSTLLFDAYLANDNEHAKEICGTGIWVRKNAERKAVESNCALCATRTSSRRKDSNSPAASAKVGASLTSSGDRKSTRLNSSHVAISYAVFCLKKKKN